ncbi:hypothetical protein [Photobacterium kishitanii]|uniref:hypothetical protein n=1 Tax=Photobacterium kishitanii TaxID=318456 RepID=UPI0011B21B9B|nr:hypothetical protein [Photobacterium kishitanii]
MNSKNCNLVSLEKLVKKHGRRYSNFLSMVADRTNEYSIHGEIFTEKSCGNVRLDIENPRRYVPTVSVLTMTNKLMNEIASSSRVIDSGLTFSAYLDAVLRKDLPCLAAAIDFENKAPGIGEIASSASGKSDGLFRYVAPDILLNRCIADKYPLLQCDVADILKAEVVYPSEFDFYLETDEFDAIVSSHKYAPAVFENLGIFGDVEQLESSMIVEAIIISKRNNIIESTEFCSALISCDGEINTDDGYVHFDVVKSILTLYSLGIIVASNDVGIADVISKIDNAESLKKISKLIRRLDKHRTLLKMKG